MASASDRMKEILVDLKKVGYTQSTFAEELGRDQGTVSKWLTGFLKVPDSVAIIIEAKFGFRKEWILKGKLPKKFSKKLFRVDETRTSNLGIKLDSAPELRDILDLILKLPQNEYDSLMLTIKRFVKKK